jgi:hypothetical protein
VKRADIERILWDCLAKAYSGGGGSSSSIQSVPFSFDTPSPMVLQTLAAGQEVIRVSLAISTPFNDDAATVQVGVSGDPGALLGPGDTNIVMVGQYTTDAITVFSSSEILLLTISPGSSTQGAGLLLFAVTS